jgi:hypothetical protein
MNDEPSSRFPRRKILLGALSLAAIYVVGYAVLSATGGFVICESGEARQKGENGFSFAQSDTFVWLPRYGFYQKIRQEDGSYAFRRDFLGGVFTPMILLDQKFFHPTIPFRDARGELLQPIPAPPFQKYHPFLANRFYGRWPYENPPGAEQGKAAE